nr:autotransporter domain-containing protein [uncultured Methylophaga sp.]
MNRAYRIVWNASRQLWMVAGELTRGRTKSQVSRKKHTLNVMGQALIVAGSLSYAANATAGMYYYWDATTGNWADSSKWMDATPPVNNGNDVIIMGDRTAIVNSVVNNDSNRVTVGINIQSGTSTLRIENGGKLTAENLDVANSNITTGRVVVTGAGSTLTVTEETTIGIFGTASLTVSEGAELKSGTLVIGKYIYGQASSTLNIGADENDAAAGAGVVDVDTLTFGPRTGKLVLNHTNTASDYLLQSNIEGSGTITLSGGRTRFTGGLTDFNGGMRIDGGSLSVTAGNTLTLGKAGSTADYTQTLNGLLRFGLIDASNYGKLNVTGTATFADGSKLDVDVQGAPSLTNGGRLSNVITAGNLNATNFDVTDSSALYDFRTVVDGNAVELVIVPEGYSGDLSEYATGSVATGTAILNSVNNVGFKPGRGAARALDGFMNSGTTGNDIEVVTTALGRLSNDQQVSQAVAETLPLLVDGTTKVAANTLHSTNRVIQGRQATTSGLSSGDDFLTARGVWLKPVGSWTRQHERNGVSGYDADAYGFVGGIDGELTPSSRLGFALSYMNTNVDGNGSASGNKADIDAYQAIAYGSHDLAQFENVEVNWQADVGINKNDGKRRISFMNRTATADYDSYTAHVGAGIGKRFELNEQSTVMPSIRADYAYIKDESYKEKGAGALNLDVDSIHTDEFIVMAQTELNHQLNEKTTLLANVGLGYDLINDDTSLTASYAGGGTAFTTEGIDPSPWLARAGVGATVNLNDFTDITAQYDVEGREDFLNQTASVKLRMSF